MNLLNNSELVDTALQIEKNKKIREAALFCFDRRVEVCGKSTDVYDSSKRILSISKDRATCKLKIGPRHSNVPKIEPQINF